MLLKRCHHAHMFKLSGPVLVKVLRLAIINGTRSSERVSASIPVAVDRLFNLTADFNTQSPQLIGM